MDKLNTILKEKPVLKLLGKKKLKQELKQHGISNKTIDTYFDSLEINQMLSNVKPNKDAQLRINAPPFSYQIDIVLFPKYKASNSGIDKFLLLVDILSRKAFAYILKSGRMSDVLEAYKSFVKDVGKDRLKSVSGDNFFNNKQFLDYNEKIGVNVYHDVAQDDHLTKEGNKLGIIDRLVRTLKKYMLKHILSFNTTKWTLFLDDVIDLYNNTIHSSIRRKPIEAYDDMKFLINLYIKQKEFNEDIKATTDLNIGDKVRTRKSKGAFEKEDARFSREVYTIDKTDGNRYRLRDENGELKKRKYKAMELLKVKNVEERIDNSKKKQDERVHKHVGKLRKELGESYKESLERIRSTPVGLLRASREKIKG